MAKNKAGRDIWFERSLMGGTTPIRTEGLVLYAVTPAVGLILGAGGIGLATHYHGLLKALGALMVVALPIWVIGAFVLAIRHTGPWGSSWKN